MEAQVRQSYAERAEAVQNHPANAVIDIVTFVYMAQTEDQARRHVEYYEARAKGSN